MKKRLGFVSNSSSSSFICDVCGEMESGWDMCYADAEMYGCTNGHTFHERYLVNDVSTKELKDNLINKWKQWTEEYPSETWAKEELQKIEELEEDEIYDYCLQDRGEIDPLFCPICQNIEFSDHKVLRFLMEKYNLNQEDILKEMREVNYK